MAIFSRPVVILCTSPSGSGRDLYLSEFQNTLSKRQREEVRVVRLRDEIFEVYKRQGVTTGAQEILDLEDRTRNRYRFQAILKLKSSFKQPGCYIVSTPHPILWKGDEKEGISLADVNRLKPDMFVTIIDDVARTREVLKTDSQFANHRYTIKDLALWRASTIKDTIAFAASLKKPLPFYLIARDHPPEVLRDLIFNRKKGRAYFSFPITNMSKDGISSAKRFVNQLRNSYIVFDPLTIKDHSLISAATKAARKRKRVFTTSIQHRNEKRVFKCSVKEVEDATEALDTQVVDRDFRLIDQSESVIVYYPIRALAAGVISEMFYGFWIAGKHVHAWHPHAPSPFFRYFCWDRKVFENFSDFKRFLNRRKVSAAREPAWKL